MASLHVAVLFNDEGLTRSLLKEGFDVNTYDTRLGTPLSIAVHKGYRSIVRLLHEHGADHNSEQFTSALIHSDIDELKLPDLTMISRQSALLYGGKYVTDIYGDQMGEVSTSPVHEPQLTYGSVKTLYNRDGKLEEAPTGTETHLNHYSGPTAQDDQAACLIEQIMELNDGSKWSVSEFHVSGPKLCRFVSRVLEGYPGASHGQSELCLHTRIVAVDFDFIGLFHRSEDYVRLCEEEFDVATKVQAELLLQCLKPLWQSLHDLVEQSKITGLVEHAHLVLIYRPGEVVIMRSNSKDINKLTAAKLKHVKPKLNIQTRVLDWQLTVEVMNWNGFSTGYERRRWPIQSYYGSQRIDTQIFPLSYAADPDALQKSLVRRGRKFESFRGCSFMTRKEFNIERRVIIDNYAYYRFQSHFIPAHVGLDYQPGHWGSDYDSDPYEMPPLPVSMNAPTFRSDPDEREASLPPLTDDECLVCVPTMHGFDIQEKKWNEVEVGGLESVIWNDQAFTHLTMQEDQKRLILAFAKQKQIEETKFDDFIEGKGKSLIILLCGPPGVGKTLTAESVAERAKAPLYTLSAGDLGTNAHSVEDALKKALDLCSHWKAVMLIDEADVFLEARKTDNLKRNELVSVFLRLLEYYNGILFLTTNRAATLDAAFESRIDLIIPYEDLDQAARRQIWDNFVKTLLAASHELCDADFDELSRRELNGREIKSTVKTALMLATSEGQTLQMQHINVVLNIRQRAADYLHGEA